VEPPSQPPGSSDTSRLINGLVCGDSAITQEFVARIHAELRTRAARHMAGQRPGHTLQTTALVNEVWTRLLGREDLHFEGRRQFYGFASRVMRAVLVDHARNVEATKRGGDRQRLSISVAAGQADARDQDQVVDLLDLDAALVRLKEQDGELARVVELRYFGGLQNATVAEVLGVSERTVERHWRLARAWLLDELSR
jgi:RNA polymerase sigma-70 factor (ECF subfamily)